jgi:hypothetical protein
MTHHDILPEIRGNDSYFASEKTNWKRVVASLCTRILRSIAAPREKAIELIVDSAQDRWSDSLERKIFSDRYM